MKRLLQRKALRLHISSLLTPPSLPPPSLLPPSLPPSSLLPPPSPPHSPLPSRTALEALTRAKFSTASDVWSYGITLWEIYSLGRTPWEGLSPVEIRDKLESGDRLGRPERCSPKIYMIMLSCWEHVPQDRPNFATIVNKLEPVSEYFIFEIITESPCLYFCVCVCLCTVGFEGGEGNAGTHSHRGRQLTVVQEGRPHLRY